MLAWSVESAVLDASRRIKRQYLPREYVVFCGEICDTPLKMLAFLKQLLGDHAFVAAGFVGLYLLSICKGLREQLHPTVGNVLSLWRCLMSSPVPARILNPNPRTCRDGGGIGRETVDEVGGSLP